MARTPIRIKLEDAEYLQRRRTILERLGERGITALVVFTPHNVSYYGRFGFIATERPIGLLITEKSASLLIPALETEHAEEFALVDNLIIYPEYPGRKHPMEFLADALTEAGLSNASIGVDSDGYGRLYGYRGAKISELLPDSTVVDVLDDIEYQQMINSEAELDLIRESCHWAGVAHRYLQDYSEVGVSESVIAARASTQASREMVEALGPEFRTMAWGGGSAFAGFRGQVGKASAHPHAISNNVKLAAGDMLVTGASSYVWGYSSELERSMVMGEPTEEQARYFDLMLRAQTLACDAIKPGRLCSDVDREVLRFFEEEGIQQYWRHHTGHAKSMLIHEAPFLDIGDDRELEVGMVFTVEPGIYVPDFAGFRHSDTVAVTEDGVEFLTQYPRELKDLIIPVG